MFGNQQMIIATPTGFTPSPPLYQSEQKRTITDQTTSPVLNNQDRTYYSNTVSPLPTLFKTTPSLGTDVLDFAAIVREKFQGKVLCFHARTLYFVVLQFVLIN